VTLKANQVTSTKAQIPFDYYDLPFCRRKHTSGKTDNLGERLSGDKATNSPYVLKMKQEEKCAFLCRKVVKPTELRTLRHMIDNDYRVHWLLDNLPVAVRNEELNYVTRGYPVGYMGYPSGAKKPHHYLYNHVRIVVRYSEIPEEFSGSRIVGFEVVPFSVKHKYEEHVKSPTKETVLSTCNQFSSPDGVDASSAASSGHVAQTVEGTKEEEIIFTYDVKWEPSAAAWSSRWDVYMHGNPDDEIHYFSIINSFMIVLFLTGVVAMIMLRTLRKDIASYNEMQTLEEAQEESGWKLVHGDVFRPPTTSPMLLAVLAGTGVQLLTMAFFTMICAVLGLMSPANRGALLTSLLLIYVFLGSIAGYNSARMYKLFQGKQWKQSTILTAVFFPSVMGSIFICINIFIRSQGSTTTPPVSTMVSVLALLFGVSTPLVFVGSYFGFQKETIETPVRTNQIARHIPEQVWYTHPLFSIALGGVLPFGAVCIELFFIMSAMWLHQLYFVFGFLFIVLFILVATCAEISIVMCYFQLCNEDYNWWWRAYLSSGSSGVYLFLYSIWYFHAKLNIQEFVSIILYFSYMAMIALTFSITTGAVGFFSCLWFVRKIYGAIKVD
jgi:transmembrane 9 superfamily protein 2/4